VRGRPCNLGTAAVGSSGGDIGPRAGDGVVHPEHVYAVDEQHRSRARDERKLLCRGDPDNGT
jgi:hypothetical protein